MSWDHSTFLIEKTSHIYWITLEPEVVTFILISKLDVTNNPHKLSFISVQNSSITGIEKQHLQNPQYVQKIPPQLIILEDPFTTPPVLRPRLGE